MSEDQRNINGNGAPPHQTEVLATCQECGQLYDRTNPGHVRYHEHPGHKPRQRHNLRFTTE